MSEFLRYQNERELMRNDTYAASTLAQMMEVFDDKSLLYTGKYATLLTSNHTTASSAWEFFKRVCIPYNEIKVIIKYDLLNLKEHSKIISKMINDTEGRINIPMYKMYQTPECVSLDVLDDIFYHYDRYGLGRSGVAILSSWVRYDYSFDAIQKLASILHTHTVFPVHLDLKDIIHARNKQVFDFLLEYFKVQIIDVSLPNPLLIDKYNKDFELCKENKCNEYKGLVSTIVSENTSNVLWMLPYIITKNWANYHRTADVFTLLTPKCASAELVRWLHGLGFDTNVTLNDYTFADKLIKHFDNQQFGEVFDALLECGYKKDFNYIGGMICTRIEFASYRNNRHATTYFLERGDRFCPLSANDHSIDIPGVASDLESIRTIMKEVRSSMLNMGYIMLKAARCHVCTYMTHMKRFIQKHNLYFPDEILLVIVSCLFDKEDQFLSKEHVDFLIWKHLHEPNVPVNTLSSL